MYKENFYKCISFFTHREYGFYLYIIKLRSPTLYFVKINNYKHTFTSWLTE